MTSPTWTRALPLDAIESTGLIEPADADHTRVFLRPGDWYAGCGPHHVTTLLGSCVSVMMWSPAMQWGAMSHCLLPARPRHARHDPTRDAGHYVDEALDWMALCLARRACSLTELRITVAGGARCTDAGIGEANVSAALDWLKGRGLRAVHCDTGGAIVRKLAFNVADGTLLVLPGGHPSPTRGR